MPGVPSRAALRLRCIKLSCLNSHLADVHERYGLVTSVDFYVCSSELCITGSSHSGIGVRFEAIIVCVGTTQDMLDEVLAC